MERLLTILLVAVLSCTFLGAAAHSVQHLGELYGDLECPICPITGNLILAIPTPPTGEPLAPAVPIVPPGDCLVRLELCIFGNTCRAPPPLPA